MGRSQKCCCTSTVTKTLNVMSGEYIICRAQELKLDPSMLYEAVVDLSSDGLLTSNSVNIAAGILLDELGLPDYFFQNITKESLQTILKTIAGNIRIRDGKAVLSGSVSQVQTDLNQGESSLKVRIATEDTRGSMETMLGPIMAGHRREYYYSPEHKYYTYLFRPECVNDFKKEDFKKSNFLFGLSSDYATTPETTRLRYEKFLKNLKTSVSPLIEVYNLPSTGETRFMILSDFMLPQLPIFRKIFAERGIVLNRAYWEPFYTGNASASSVCSLYALGEITRKVESEIKSDLYAFLALALNKATSLFVEDKLTFKEMLFASNLIDFTHMFVFKENHADADIYHSLKSLDHKDAFATRIYESTKSTYIYKRVSDFVYENIDLMKVLFRLFDSKFNPDRKKALSEKEISEALGEYEKTIAVRFMEDSIAYDTFRFMPKIITNLYKTNFYKDEKRSFAFRFDNGILDPLVFNQFVYGIFYVNGHYACGTHMRAKDIARGGLRLLRITAANYGAEIDKAVLLNYALGPKAQRLKHKDICESGSKGVVVPHIHYANQGMSAMYDYTEGIMDLVLHSEKVVDYLGKPEMVFFGPDEGTAPMMDAVSYQTRERGYKYWRTITTGKSFGVPHDVYGILTNGDLFGLLDRGQSGTELQINGKSIVSTTDMDKIYDKIGGKIETSGMTTSCIMSTFRTLIGHGKDKEENLPLMMTGGPDGDLGSNQIQCYKGKICLIIDGGSILFDPNGLDKKELMKISFMRHTMPRANSLFYPREKLSKNGFMVERLSKNINLPDGTLIEDGAIFHKNFLTNPESKKYIAQAGIKAFIPCGGFKDTINRNNVSLFLDIFSDLKYIVEGANVFFDDTARRYIAKHSKILQIKDSSANKGGVMSSSLAEVLTAFILGDDYEKYMINDVQMRWDLIRDVMAIVRKAADDETKALINLHEIDKNSVLTDLSVSTSEEILALQDKVEVHLKELLDDKNLVWNVLENYVPKTLTKKLGKDHIVKTLSFEKLQPYRNAIITKKLASMAFYKFASDFDKFTKSVDKNFASAIKSVL